ncbi:OPT family oligopeptide transporter [Actinosynnema pretiosum]|uniref:OPT family oligopeptide transporter n=1 Tax=Actinosynnema pretiosum TaxID=42197 RepID=UPI000B0F30AE|nr:OPT family oligopeptide transporter [Actinosynnema pretiosum]
MSLDSSKDPATPTTGDAPEKHPRAFEPITFVIIALLSVLGAIIGLHMITTLGVSPNTSVIGALVAMVVGRFAFLGLARMRSVHRQNLAQSAISGSTFAAANSLLIPMAIPFVFGKPELVWPVFIGAGLGLAIDVWILYRGFGSSFLPAHAAWPPGVAAAETIKAGDSGGRQAKILAVSGVLGFGASFAGLPMSAAGVALIGNVWALGMFGVGLLAAQYAPVLFNVKLAALYVPHGVMIGAGLVALVQAALLLLGRRSKKSEAKDPRREGAEEKKAAAAKADGSDADLEDDPSMVDTVTIGKLRRAFSTGYLLYVGGAAILAVLAGVHSELSVPALIGWVLFAAFAAIVHEIIVGLAAMHAGWFPAFAVTLIFLIVGLFLGFPQVPLMVLVAYCAATGPAFADMGYDLKAGWLLRRAHRPYSAFELEGRRQQLLASVIGFAVAVGAVALLWQSYFTNGDVPPVSKVYADTIKAGLGDPEVLRNLLIWAVPGAIIQLIGGPKRQIGVLLATGLLVATPNAGWLVLAALALRVLWVRKRGPEGENDAALVGAGLIAGDSINSVGRIFRG